MASLRDQLLKSGLADANKAKKVHKDKRKQSKAARKSNQKIVDESKIAAERIISQQAERDRALNVKRQAQVEKKAIGAQIIQLIKMNKLNRQECEISFSFVHNNKVKHIYVNETIQTQLSAGYLAIVHYLNNKNVNYEVVPSIVAKKISERDAQAVIQIDQSDHPDSMEDDPYSEYAVPDDLMW